MLMKNRSDRDVLLPAEMLEGKQRGDENGKVRVSPGQEVECREGYCWPRRKGNGSRKASLIEQYCPGMSPADDSLLAQWKETPEKDWEPSSPPVTAASLVAAGQAPAVAKLMLEEEADKMAAPKEEKPEERKPKKKRPKKSAPEPSEGAEE